MTTRLVVVLRDAANLGSQDAQPCGAPAHVRAVTASCSPPPRVGRRAGAPSARRDLPECSLGRQGRRAAALRHCRLA
jgi:hypothetical protein